MKIYTFLAEGFEETEAIAVIDLLRRAEFDVVTISAADNKTVTGSHKISVICDTAISDSDFKDGDALFFPGGVPGVPNLAKNNKILNLIKSYYNRGSYLIALCAAPYLFDLAGILNDKNFTCFPSWREKINTGKYCDAPVVCDGKIITGKSMGASISLGLKIIETIKGRPAAAKIADSIYFIIS